MSNVQTPEAPSSNRRAARKPDYTEKNDQYGEISVWIDDRNDGNPGKIASISVGNQGAKTNYKCRCDIPGMDGPLSAQEIAILFSGRPVVTDLQPQDATKNPYEVTLVRHTKTFDQPWKSDPTKVDRWLDVATAIHVYRDKVKFLTDENKNPVMDPATGKQKTEIVTDESGNPVKKLHGYKVNKVIYPAWYKHGDGTFIGPVDARGAVRLADGETLTDKVNGVDFSIKLTGMKQNGQYLNPEFSITKGPAEEQQQVVDQSESAPVGRGQGV